MPKLSHAATFAAAAVLALTLGCKAQKADTSRVIANVGGEKITEAEFQEVVRTLSQDPKEAEDFLSNPAARDNRAQLAHQIALSKAIIAYGKETGLDQDPVIRRQLEQQTAMLYFQALAKKRAQAAEPTEAQLRAFYQEQVALLKAQGQAQGVPPFEAVKAQLAEGYKRTRIQAVSAEIEKDVKAKIPVTLADDYRPASVE